MRQAVSLSFLLLILSSVPVLRSPGEAAASAAARAPAPDPSPSAEALAPPSEHWPLHPLVAERVLQNAPIRILEDRYAGRGMTGARRLLIELPDRGTRFQAKWKPVNRRLDGINNSPRRELAAYAVQKLFLEPPDYVVPTARLRCLGPDDFADPEQAPRPGPGGDCRLGVLSIWVEAVELPDRLPDLERFARDPLYAARLADFNLATHLMKHRDGRRGNILVSPPGAPPRFFAIDNGVTFGGIFYNWFVPNWDDLRVPALRRQSVERLRRLRPEQLEALGVVAQLERDGTGGLRIVPPGPNLEPDEGLRRRDGTIQLGLDDDEIEDLRDRIEELIEDVDEGELAVF